MPTYQYACTACGHELEAVQSFTDDPLSQCPACEGRLRKLFGSVGVVFKGPGFYRTDSRAGASGSNGSNASEAGKSGEPSGSSGDSGTTDGKTSATSDSKDGAKSDSKDGAKAEKASAKAGSGTSSAA